MPDTPHYDLPHSAYERLIEARDSLRLLDGYVNKTNVMCNPSMLADYVSLLQNALQEVIAATSPAQPRGTFKRKVDQLGYVALNPKEQTMIEHLRWTSIEGREDIYALAARLRYLKPWIMEP